ncbi:MAG TPA: DUF4124 domain-containing protein [Burkholderiaceae bacterium]
MAQRYAAGLAAAALLAGLPSAAFAGVYKCVGPDGGSTFSDKPCPVNGNQKQAVIGSDSALSSAMARDRRIGESCSDMSDRSRRCNVNIHRTILTHFQESCYGPQHRYEIENSRELAKQHRGQPIDWDHDPRYHQKTGAELKCDVLVTDMWQFVKDNFQRDLTEQEIKAVDYQVQATETNQPADARQKNGQKPATIQIIKTSQ